MDRDATTEESDIDRGVTTEVDSDDDLDIVVERIGSKFALNLFLINRGGGRHVVSRGRKSALRGGWKFYT